MSTKKLFTMKELTTAVNRKTTLKRVRYAIFVRTFLPTGDEKGFPGLTLLNVSKKTFLDAAADMLKVLEERGAKIEVNVPEEDFEAWIF